MGADRGSLAKIKDEVEYFQHQVDGVRAMARMRSFLLADEMGLGKSLQALTVAAVDFERGWAERVLIVVPASLVGNWAEEIEANTHFTYDLLVGTPAKRRKLLDKWRDGGAADVLIASYEGVKTHLIDLNRLDFDIVILDEAHYIKTHNSARTKAILQLAARRYFLLTGSPLLNEPTDLWPMLHLINPDAYPKYWSFVHRYCVFGEVVVGQEVLGDGTVQPRKRKKIVGAKNEQELRSKLSAVMVRREKKDCLDLPDKQIIPVWVDLTREQRHLYDVALGELFDPTAPEVLLGEGDEGIENALTRFLRLKQIASTTFNIDPATDSSSKLDLLEERAEEILGAGEKLVVFSQFVGTQNAAFMRLQKRGLRAYLLNAKVPKEKRAAKVREWGDWPEPAVLVVSLQVGGVGLNMTQASKCIFLDKLYVPALNDQAVDRLHRIGADTSKPVQAYEFLARDTIESRIEQILKRKRALFSTVVNNHEKFKRLLVQALREQEKEAA